MWHVCQKKQRLLTSLFRVYTACMSAIQCTIVLSSARATRRYAVCRVGMCFGRGQFSPALLYHGRVGDSVRENSGRGGVARSGMLHPEDSEEDGEGGEAHA